MKNFIFVLIFAQFLYSEKIDLNVSKNPNLQHTNYYRLLSGAQNHPVILKNTLNDSADSVKKAKNLTDILTFSINTSYNFSENNFDILKNTTYGLSLNLGSLTKINLISIEKALAESKLKKENNKFLEDFLKKKLLYSLKKKELAALSECLTASYAKTLDDSKRLKVEREVLLKNKLEHQELVNYIKKIENEIKNLLSFLNSDCFTDIECNISLKDLIIFFNETLNNGHSVDLQSKEIEVQLLKKNKDSIFSSFDLHLNGNFNKAPTISLRISFNSLFKMCLSSEQSLRTESLIHECAYEMQEQINKINQLKNDVESLFQEAVLIEELLTLCSNDLGYIKKYYGILSNLIEKIVEYKKLNGDLIVYYDNNN